MQKILKYLEGDKVIWLLTMFLALVSVITVFSFIPVLVKSEGGNPIKYIGKHVFFLGIGLAVMFYVHRINPKYFMKLSKFLFYLAVTLLVFTFFFGVRVNDAGRWIKIPFLPFTFQTSDFAKLALILYLSKVLAVKKDKIKDFKEGFRPVIIPVLIVCGLILRDNFSTSAMLFVICSALIYLAGAKLQHLFATLGVLIGGVGLLISMHFAAPDLNIFPRAETWANRVSRAFSDDSEATQLKENPQVVNARKAIASAPFFGKGPGNGELKHYIAEAYADFYFASFIEEFGPLMGIVIILIYLILFFRKIKISIRAEKLSETYVVIGLGMVFMFQAIVNMGVCTGIFPVTGQNMPLLGMGGSSMVMTCLGLGMILSISRKYTSEPEKEANQIKNSDQNEFNIA